MHRLSTLLLAGVLASSASAAQREAIHATWEQFREQVATGSLNGRSARVVLVSSESVRADILGVDEHGLTVRQTGATKRWRSSPAEARIPKAEIRSVRFSGRTGKGRWIGAAAGLAGGAGIGAAVATSTDIDEGPGIIIIPVVAAGIAIAGAVGGYFAGRSQDRPRPEFVLTP